MLKDLLLEFLLLVIALILGTVFACQLRGQELTPGEAESLSEQAFIAGFPVVENYKALLAEAVDENGDQFVAPLNTLSHSMRAFSAGAESVETPNVDVGYSVAWLDLRTEPVMLDVPEVEDERYFSIQLVDLYNYNFSFIGTRSTGNHAAKYLLAGPDWQGPPPPEIDQVIQCETRFAFVRFQIQVFGPDDTETVQAIQSNLLVQSLSTLLGQSAPQLSPDLEISISDSPAESHFDFLNLVNTALKFCPPNRPESKERDPMSRIGVVAGQPFDSSAFSAEIQEAIKRGMEKGAATIDTALASANTALVFGARDPERADFLRRAVGARVKLHGISREERLNSLYRSDNDGNPLDASQGNYVLRLLPADLPPVNAFWSLTMYDGQTQDLVPNPIGRYLINSAMLPELTTNSDGKIEIQIQHEPPAEDRVANWLPAPDGPFYMVLRLYWPKPDAWDGTWNAPLVAPATSLLDDAKPAGAEVTQEVKPVVLDQEGSPELERPTAWGEPTEVRVMIYLIDIDDVDSADQSFAASVYVKATWNNPLLRHQGPGPKQLGLTEVWNPRLTILGQQMAWRSYPEAVEVQPDGTVVYRQKLWGRFSQPLNLRDFPLDQQQLSIHIVAAGLLEEDVKIIPLTDLASGRSSHISEQFSLPDFDVVSWEANPAPYFPIRDEPGVVGYEMKVHVQRQVTYYVLKVIVPLCLIVIMSWLPRWIDPEQGGTNIGISTTAFLTLIAYLFAITVFLPRVSYVTRMDRFILLSTLIVFAGLLQTVANTSLVKKKKTQLVERTDFWSRIVYPLLLAAILVLSFVV